MNNMLAQLAAGFPSGMNFGGGVAPQQPNPMQTGPMAGTPIMPQQQGGMPQPMPSQMPQFGSANGTMGLGSPFFTERPTGGLPTQQFTPTRDNAMGGNAMAMLGMSPNFGNMVGPTSALPPEMQPQGSQLKMWGMEDQMAQPAVPEEDQGVSTQDPFGGMEQLIRSGAIVPNEALSIWGNAGSDYAKQAAYNTGKTFGYGGMFGEDYVDPYLMSKFRDQFLMGD